MDQKGFFYMKAFTIFQGLRKHNLEEKKII